VADDTWFITSSKSRLPPLLGHCWPFLQELLAFSHPSTSTATARSDPQWLWRGGGLGLDLLVMT
jgi:hypothetical protein